MVRGDEWCRMSPMTEHNHEGTTVHLQNPKRDLSALYIPGAIIIAAIIIGGGLFFGLSSKGTGQAQGGTQPVANVDIKDVKTDGIPFIGNANAPVTMAFWSDFQCPYCKAFETGGIPQIPTPAAMPDLIKQYVDTGKLKIVFKDYPFLGEDSTIAAEYGRAIWDLYPAQYFAWRTAMYEAQDDEGDQGFGDAASIDALIKKSFPQMNASKIKSQVATKKSQYDAAIQADQQEGASMGVSGTPGFIVGKTLISGAEQFARFKAVIDPLVK